MIFLVGARPTQDFLEGPEKGTKGAFVCVLVQQWTWPRSSLKLESVPQRSQSCGLGWGDPMLPLGLFLKPPCLKYNVFSFQHY